MQTRSIGPISCSTSCSTWSGSPRSARMPPWILGCSVLPRPPSISGAPVTSEMGTTLTPASVSVLAVPPVEMISNPIPESRSAKSSIPLLSDTEIRALRFIPPPSPGNSLRQPERATCALQGATFRATSPSYLQAQPAPAAARRSARRLLPRPCNAPSPPSLLPPPQGPAPRREVRGTRARAKDERSTQQGSDPGSQPTVSACTRPPPPARRRELRAWPQAPYRRFPCRRTRQDRRARQELRTAAPARTRTPPCCSPRRQQGSRDMRRAMPAGSYQNPKPARRSASLRAAAQTNSRPPASTTSPIRQASQPTPRSASSPVAAPSGGTTAQKPTPRLKTLRISLSGKPPSERISPKTPGSDHDPA